MLHVQTSYPIRSFLQREVAKSRRTSRGQQGQLSDAASNDTTSKHGRLNVGIFLLIHWRNFAIMTAAALYSSINAGAVC